MLEVHLEDLKKFAEVQADGTEFSEKVIFANNKL